MKFVMIFQKILKSYTDNIYQNVFVDSYFTVLM